jgi:hypothetical protein
MEEKCKSLGESCHFLGMILIPNVAGYYSQKEKKKLKLVSRTYLLSFPHLLRLL